MRGRGKNIKVLFLLKERYYNNTNLKSYGLINSSKQLAKYLESIGLETKVSVVVDGNAIDKVVFEYNPDVVIIEAIWVAPSKLRELMELKRYRHIKWVVRVHSDIGFLSAETLALNNINDYINIGSKQLMVAPNHRQFTEYLSMALNHEFTYLPNVVDVNEYFVNPNKGSEKFIDIGCFGAMRVMKNQVFQAICAMRAADELGKKMRFHITIDAKAGESKIANPVVRNLEELFKNSRHELVKHFWMDNEEFQDLVKKMDIGLQLSCTESFNIVTTDFINNDVPVIVSDAISWMPELLRTSTTNYDEVVKKIKYVYNHRGSRALKELMFTYLVNYNEAAKHVWSHFVKDLLHDHRRRATINR